MKKTTNLHLRISEKLYNDLKEVAAKKETSVSSLVRLLVSNYVEANKK